MPVDWIEVNDPRCYEVIKFDDGNDAYQHYPNKWFINATWKGKVRLKNIDQRTILPSISAWKIIMTTVDGREPPAQ